MEPLFAPLDRVYLNAAGRSPLPLPSLAAGLAAAQRKATGVADKYGATGGANADDGEANE